MPQKEQGLGLITLLSALAYSCAFVIPPCWWMIGIGLALLWFVVVNLAMLSWQTAAMLGCMWGLVQFGIHTLWLIPLLLYKLACPLAWALSLYALLVCYFALWIGLFFVAMSYLGKYLSRRLLRFICAMGATHVLFMLFARYGLFIFGMSGGYPFASPCIPLAHLLCAVDESEQIIQQVPVPYTQDGTRKRYPPLALSQYYFHQLCQKTQNRKEGLFVAAESAYPFALNTMPEIISFFSSALNEEQHLLLGSVYSVGPNQDFQALYWITHSGLRDIYLKKHAVPFFERMPTFLKKCTTLRAVLNAEHDFCTDTEKEAVLWRITPSLQLRPAICSEFFLGSYRFAQSAATKDSVVMLVVNDGWYVAYFRKIMENLTQLDAVRLGVRIVYVGHFTTKVMLPKGLLCKFICSKMLKMLV